MCNLIFLIIVNFSLKMWNSHKRYNYCVSLHYSVTVLVLYYDTGMTGIVNLLYCRLVMPRTQYVRRCGYCFVSYVVSILLTNCSTISWTDSSQRMLDWEQVEKGHTTLPLLCPSLTPLSPPECLEALGELIQNNGMSVCQPGGQNGLLVGS